MGLIEGRGLGAPLPGRGRMPPLPGLPFPIPGSIGLIEGRGLGAEPFAGRGRIPVKGFFVGRLNPPPVGLPLPMPESMGLNVWRGRGAEFTVLGLTFICRWSRVNLVLPVR